jgi:hypothetical protein
MFLMVSCTCDFKVVLKPFGGCVYVAISLCSNEQSTWVIRVRLVNLDYVSLPF